MKLLQGGQGSGNFNHSGRPGEVGGSKPSKVNKDFVKPFTKWDLSAAYSKLDDNQKRFLDSWSDTEVQLYRGFNHFLRTGYLLDEDSFRGSRMKRYYADATKVIDTCFQPLRTDVQVYRGVTKSMEWSVGDEFIDKGYVSTSLSSKVAVEGFGIKGFPSVSTNFVLYRIHLKKGQKFIGITKNNEEELLLPRNTKFRVTGVSNDSRSYHTTARFGSLSNQTEREIYHNAKIFDLEVIE